MSFLVRLFDIAISTALALGWKIIETLETNKWLVLDQDKKLWYLSILTTLFLTRQVALSFPKPSGISFVDKRKDIVEEYLSRLLLSYKKAVSSISPHMTAPTDVRATVLLPTRGFLGLRNAFLMIYYYSGISSGAAFPINELAIKWKKKNGICGYSWKTGEKAIYDANNPSFNGPSETLTKQQQVVVGRLKSILSIPIVDDNKVIGVLCLDSEHDTTMTLFHERDIVLLASACADRLRAQCCENGVKR